MRKLLSILALGAALLTALPALAWEAQPSSGGGYAARLAASAAVKTAGGGSAKPVLSVVCGAGGLLVTLSWPDDIPLKPNQHFVSVAWSLDGKASVSSMLASAGSVGFGGSEAKEWLRELVTARRLEVHVPDARGGQAASFDLTGAAAVQAGIARSTCA
ncbi:MAG TPA: hypothetical protein VIJ94_09380 [Caulobacteraceae bacterium]